MAIGGVILVVALASQFYMVRARMDQAYHQIVHESQNRAETIGTSAAHMITSGDMASLESMILRFSRFFHVARITITDKEGRTLVEAVTNSNGVSRPLFDYPVLKTPSLETIRETLDPKNNNDYDRHGLKHLDEHTRRYGRINNQLVFWAPVANGIHLGWVRLLIRTDRLEAVSHTATVEALALSLVLVVLSFAVIGWFLGPRVRIIAEATRFAHNLSRNLGATLPVQKLSLETHGLIRALNGLSLRIKKLEQELLANSEWLQSLYDHVNDGIITIDENGDILTCNAAAERLFGYTSKEVTGRPITSLMTGLKDMSKRQGPTGQGVVLDARAQEIEATHRDGNPIYVEFCMGQMDLPEQKAFILTIRDCTNRKRSEDRLRESETRLADAQRLAQFGNWHWNIKGNVLTWSDQVFIIFGLDKNKVELDFQKSFMDAIHPEDREMVEQEMQRCRDTLESYDIDYRINLPDGTTRYINVKGVINVDRADRAVSLSGTVVDISGRKAAERTIRESEERFSATFNHAATGMALIAPDGKILRANERLCDMLGYSREKICNFTTTAITCVEDIPDEYPLTADLLAGKAHQYTMEKRFLSSNGEKIWVNQSVSLIRDQDGKPAYFVAVIEDIRDRKKYDEELQHLAHYDTLTGLPNRTLFNDRLDETTKRARRSGTEFAVMFLDLDRFKKINDTFGHKWGDEFLNEVAARIQKCVRDADTVSRLSGDEFAIILHDIDGGERAAQVAKRILSSIAVPYKIDNSEVFVTSSIGISVFPDDGADAEVLLRCADSAMYSAKDAGKNNYRFFDQVLDAMSHQKLELEIRLRQAMEDGALQLHYQPKINIQEGKISGAEALLRWRDSKLGNIPPDTFIPLAEDSGLIHALGEFVLREACRQIRAWDDAGHNFGTVSVNFSIRQLFRKETISDIRQIIEEAGIAPSRIMLELAETAVIDDPESCCDFIKELRKIGVGIALDKFGIGLSSINYLRNLEISEIKIDRSFIGELDRKEESVALVSAIIRIAKGFGINCVAEGVENGEQLKFIKEIDCRFAQGFYLSKPVPAAEFERAVATALKQVELQVEKNGSLRAIQDRQHPFRNRQ